MPWPQRVWSARSFDLSPFDPIRIKVSTRNITQSEVTEQMWTDSSIFQRTCWPHCVTLLPITWRLAGLPEANTFGRSEANNCRAKATQTGRRGFSKDRFWLVRLKPSHHVCHAIVHLLWKIAIPDPNLLKLTHASDGAAEHPVRIQLFTHTGC